MFLPKLCKRFLNLPEILEKVAVENVSAFCESTPNQGLPGPEKVRNDAKERRKEEKERGTGKKRLRNLLFYK